MSDVYGMAPINRTAALVTEQAGTGDFQGMDRKHLIEALGRLEKHRASLKKLIGIRSKRHHKNVKYRYNKYKDRHRGMVLKNTLMADNIHEYIETGLAMKRIGDQLKELHDKTKKAPNK